jgi:pyruvate carboxylase
MRKIQRLLVANRSEIAIRIFRACTELGISTIAVYAEEDLLSLHRFKADEAHRIGKGLGPVAAYLSIEEILRVARETSADAIHPGYGLLSESPEFADACAANGIIFVGPSPETMRLLGNKVSARKLAEDSCVPVMPASPPLSADIEGILPVASGIGYPLMLKASWGGGGRGMRVIETENDLKKEIDIARREARAAFGKDEVYVEKLVRRARHVEVQLLGDEFGTIVHLYERDCSIQRRHQKVVERAPASFLDGATRAALCDAALKIGRASQYKGAGTVEFLVDADTGLFYFIEVNPRIQVEHTVTEEVTGIDIVKAQIRIAEGGKIGLPAETGVPVQDAIELKGHAIQCRITTENPEENFIPDYGRITAYRGAMGFGVRIDGGTAYSGAIITRSYDPLLEKVTVWAATADEAVARMNRALREYRIRGVATNLPFLENLINHPLFKSASYTTRFIDDTPELFNLPKKRDRATRLLKFIADVSVNGHPELRNKPLLRSKGFEVAPPRIDAAIRMGTRQILEQRGPDGFISWLKEQKKPLVTDTTMRDAHQSLLATRLRSRDIVLAADAYARSTPELFSLECWGGATFDTSMRFLIENPWDRLHDLRAKLPNIMTQMLLRGANGVGYTNYPDNVVRQFILQAAKGIDVFRIFDCMNWVENMRVAIDAVRESGKIAEGAICYTGDLLDQNRSKYSLNYYLDRAGELERAGCHILCIKDMAGLLKPAAARLLIGALKRESDLPIHLHTHDTSGIGGATVLAAVESGVDIVDLAMDAMSGGTAQPALGSVVAALRGTEYDTGLDLDAIRSISSYWGDVRRNYGGFESEIRSCSSDVYVHEMPGGQMTNLKEQARSLGLEDRWPEIASAYAASNRLFGDIVKVTPSSKVVGDMALMMVSQGVSEADVLDPAREVAFPDSVVDMMRGGLGQPSGGWPEDLQRKVLKGEQPLNIRPGALLKNVDLVEEAKKAETALGRKLSEDDFVSWLMYPKVYAQYLAHRAEFGPVSALPTPVFYFGLSEREETTVEIETGKNLHIRLLTISQPDGAGRIEVFFELNGQPRVVTVKDRSIQTNAEARVKIDPTDMRHVGSPIPGLVSAILVEPGQTVKAGDVLMTIEAMKMETAVRAERDGTVKELLARPSERVEAKDLLAIVD